MISLKCLFWVNFLKDIVRLLITTAKLTTLIAISDTIYYYSQKVCFFSKLFRRYSSSVYRSGT
ncbi:UNVERIFIED_CONTAM: hypothetical protein Cloal_3130 [Acetivibrio alkalicellulosi]